MKELTAQMCEPLAVRTRSGMQVSFVLARMRHCGGLRTMSTIFGRIRANPMNRCPLLRNRRQANKEITAMSTRTFMQRYGGGSSSHAQLGSPTSSQEDSETVSQSTKSSNASGSEGHSDLS